MSGWQLFSPGIHNSTLISSTVKYLVIRTPRRFAQLWVEVVKHWMTGVASKLYLPFPGIQLVCLPACMSCRLHASHRPERGHCSPYLHDIKRENRVVGCTYVKYLLLKRGACGGGLYWLHCRSFIAKGNITNKNAVNIKIAIYLCCGRSSNSPSGVQVN